MREVSPREIVDRLLPQLTRERRDKLLAVVGRRSRHLVGIMEEIYDQGNVHAVIRSSESFGLCELARVACTRQKISSRVSAGSYKWVQIRDFPTTQEAIRHYRSRGYRIGVADLSPPAISIGEVDFSRPTALIFGNESKGPRPVARELSDFYCRIPTVGFTQSLNISVAAAIAFYHVHCQHKIPLLSPSERQELLAEYLLKGLAHRPQYLAQLFSP